ncbi:MAG: TolC family protein [Elusimicrobiota bacterium]
MNALVFFFASAVCSAPPVLRIELKAAEESSQRNFPALKALEAELAAANIRADGRESLLWPRLTADASYRWLSDVTSLSVGGRTQNLGDHHNASVGPTLGWTLWDQGALKDSWRSAQAWARAKHREKEAVSGQVRLRARVAYFQAQLGLEQVRLLGDSLKLAQSQYKDIEGRRKAGASSMIDSLCAHQEVLSRSRSFRQARADLAGALRDLFALTGEEPGAELSVPLDAETALKIPDGTEAPGVVVVLDPLTQSLSLLERAAGGFDEAHPALRQAAESAEALKSAARSLRAGIWPRLLFSARTSLDYPNGPLLESHIQNIAGVSLSFPLFESGKTRKEASESESLAKAQLDRMEGIRRERSRDWLKAKDQLLSLKAQEVMDAVSTRETADLSRRFYDSYKAGRATFLEVQSANLKELEAKVQAARTHAQMLLQLAVLDDLSTKEVP